MASAKTNGASGLLAYNSDCKCLQVFDATTSTKQWNSITGAVGNTVWALTGNSGTDPSTQFIGTTDSKDLVFKVNNVERLRLTTGGLVNFSLTFPRF